MTKHLSPTNIATYHHNQCQLYVHNAFHRSHNLGSTSKVSSPLAAAQFQRRLDWEARLFHLLEVADELVRLDTTSEPKTALQIRDLILETGRELDLDKTKYIANLAFQSPSFERELVQQGYDRDAVSFGMAKPYLIKITHPTKERVVWEIIDAKSSSGLTSSHNAQIGFYHICLETLLASVQFKEMDIPQIEPSEQASIWLPNVDGGDDVSTSVSTPISLLLPPLQTFLFKTLPKILQLPWEQVEWHLNPSCRGCEFIDNCREATVKDRRLGMIPNLTVSEVRFIREVMDIATIQGLTHSSGRLTDIEELDLLVKSSGTENLEKKYAATAKRFRGLLGIQRTSEKRWSPLLEAARSREPQLTGQRVFTFPRAEDVALYISIIVDVANNTIGAFRISILLPPSQPKAVDSDHITGSSGDFILKVAGILRKIREHSPKLRTQMYTYSPNEYLAIMSHLIQAALSADAEGDMNSNIRLCLGALYEGSALLLTSFQPLILSGVLLSFLSKRNVLSKNSLQTCCERLGLAHDGTAEVLRKRIEVEQKRLAEMGGRAGGKLQKREVGQLGKVVVLKREIERLISLPIPGFVDLPRTAEALLSGRMKCESDDVIFGEWAKRCTTATKPGWEEGLKDRNRCMHALVDHIRQRIQKAGLTQQVLLNEARPLEVGMMDICRSEKIRKLTFMLQFEVVVRLQTLWQDRLDGCPNAPLLRYVRTEKKGTVCYTVFDVVSGTVEPPIENRAFYDWLLVAEPDGPLDQMKVPPEIYFDDLSLCGLIFPLNRYTKPKWDEQPNIVKNEVFVANITSMRLGTSDSETKKPRSQVIMQIFDTKKQLQKGSIYRMSPRLVDFNFNRALHNLVTMDFQDTISGENVPFIDLITDPRNFADAPSFCGESEERREKEIVRGLNELAKLGNTHAKALVLKPSQHRAAKRMMLKRLSVIWGPPGTGKTYTLALSTLRIIEALGPRALELCPIILVTATTHAAIEAIVGKINTLIGHYRGLKERDSSWLDSISLQRVFSGATHSAPTEGKVHIYAGTTYQLYKFCEKAKLMANLIIIDEAGQLALGTAALVIRWMSPRPGSSGLILAGDKEQLAPILGNIYPDNGEELPLFGSVLDLLMGRKYSGLKVAETLPNSQIQLEERKDDGAIVQLLENFRLNQDLGAFVELIYAKKFKPQKSQDTEIAESLQLWLDTESSEDPIMQQSRIFLLNLAAAMSRRKDRPSNLSPPRIRGADTPIECMLPASLALIRVRASGSYLAPYEAHVKAEAELAAALVHWLRESFGAEENIFVACPRRIQRNAVRQAITCPSEDWSVNQTEEAGLESGIDVLAAELAAFHASEQGLRIDTVERLQGSEASFVIFLLSHTHQPSLSDHLGFLLSRRRLNVGISRAKSLCIVVSSRSILQPPLEVLVKEDTRQGLEFLRAYEDRAWIGDIELAV